MCKPAPPPLKNTIAKSAMRAALKGDLRALETLKYAIDHKARDAADARRAYDYVLLIQARDNVRGSRVKSWMHDAERGKPEAIRLLQSGPWKKDEREDAQLALKYLALLRQYLEDLKEWKKAS